MINYKQIRKLLHLPVSAVDFGKSISFYTHLRNPFEDTKNTLILMKDPGRTNSSGSIIVPIITLC